MTVSALPRISIVTPSYQQGEYLEETIRSVIGEEYPNLEYIVIDGRSTDQSLDVIYRYKESLSYWVSECDRGQADALSKGFALATGEILAWLNADDTYLPGALRTIGEFFRDNRDVGLVYGDYNIVDATGRVLERKRQPSFDLSIAKYAYMTIPQQSSFWRRGLYLAVGGIDPSLKFSMDYDLFLRMAQITSVVHLRKPLSNFRHHQKSKTSRMQDVRKSEDELIQERYCGISPSSALFSLIRGFYICMLVARCVAEGCIWEKLLNQLRRKGRQLIGSSIR